MEIGADLRARQTTTSVTLDAPREGTQRSRIKWLVRQLADAPDDLRIEAAFPNARVTTVASLGTIRDDPSVLFYPPDPKREPRAFIAATSRAMGQKRGRAEGSFVRETSAQAVAFYRDLEQNLKPWTAPAPKLRIEPEAVEAATRRACGRSRVGWKHRYRACGWLERGDNLRRLHRGPRTVAVHDALTQVTSLERGTGWRSRASDEAAARS